VSKVVQLLAAYGWHPSVDGGNAAPAAADTAAEAAAASMLSKRLLVYEQFAQALDSRELLKAYFDAAIEAGELATAAGLSPFETLHYAKDLLLTGLTDWTDNPAPPIGVFDSTEGGNWGGYMHSLEVRGEARHELVPLRTVHASVGPPGVPPQLPQPRQLHCMQHLTSTAHEWACLCKLCSDCCKPVLLHQHHWQPMVRRYMPRGSMVCECSVQCDVCAAACAQLVLLGTGMRCILQDADISSFSAVCRRLPKG
jgi:hypothetical protein